jgi:hypothetical protein
MNRRLNHDNAETIVELGEADLAIVRGGTSALPWLPPSFPIKNPLPSPVLELYPALTRPNAGPRPNPSVHTLLDVRAAIQSLAIDL